MKGLIGLLAAVLILGFAGMSCKGGGEKPSGGGETPAVTSGGGADLDTCIKEYTDYTTKQAGGNMPADAIKKAAELACTTACNASAEACKGVIDALKNAPR